MTIPELLAELARLINEGDDSGRLDATVHPEDSRMLCVQVAPPDSSHRWYAFTLTATQNYP